MALRPFRRKNTTFFVTADVACRNRASMAFFVGKLCYFCSRKTSKVVQKPLEMKKKDRLSQLLARFNELGIAKQIGYEKFYLYGIITHSTAIEGSTLTEVENQLMFDEGVAPAGKAVMEQMMNLDLRDAYIKWLKWAQGTMCFTPELLCQLSASVMRRTGTVYHTALGDFDASLGEFRKVNVQAGVGGRSYMAFQKVPDKINAFCQWLNAQMASVDKNEPSDIYRLSFEAHFRLVTIHPWADGNGRSTRLLMNILQHHFSVPMSKVAKHRKAEYIQALVDARQEENVAIFIDKMMSMLCDDLEEQIRNYETDTAVDNVQKDVQKQLSERQRVLLAMIEENPSVTMAEMSRKTGVSMKTIQRELAALNVVRKGGRKDGFWSVETKQSPKG